MYIKLWILFSPLLLSLSSSFVVRSNTGRSYSSSVRRNKQDDFDDDTYIDPSDIANDQGRRDIMVNALGAGLILTASGVAATQLFRETIYTPTGFQRLPVTQFIAALGDPNAKSGTGADPWGLWNVDPGPRGVWLRDYENKLVKTGGHAPDGWKFDANDWWLEEHGLIMESPKFPIQPGRYLVTGYRDVISGLTIATDGSWRLDEGTLYDVTHLPCRAARYTPRPGETGGPQTAMMSDFPVKPGAVMPEVSGCNKQDYAVLFLIGVGK